MANHQNPRGDARTSLAPYNFVALPKQVHAIRTGGDETPAVTAAPWAAHDRYLEGTHSGWLDLRLKAETSLYVRCAPPAAHAADEDPRTNPHRRDFFHHGEPAEPVIPGSSLRGMTRALVEILGFGAFRWFTDRKLIHRAVGDQSSLGDRYRETFLGEDRGTPRSRKVFDYPLQRVRGGYLRLHGGDRFIQPAREIHGETLVHVEEDAARDGAKIRLRRANDRNAFGASDLTRVWLRRPAAREPHLTGKDKDVELRLARVREAGDIRPRTAQAAPPGGDFVPATVVRSGWSPRKHMVCALYEPDPTKNAPAQWLEIPHDLWKVYEEDRDLTRGIPTRKLRTDGDPLFYLVDDHDSLVFFGPTLMFRLPHQHTISDFVPARLRDPETLDLAEAIFGTVDRKPAIKGRVVFEDAVWERGAGEDNPFFAPGEEGLRSPKILSGPKPTSFQHYLAQPAPGSWKTLKHWSSQPEETEIRGHKRYWHKPGAQAEDPFETQVTHDSQHTIIRPVRPGTRFSGRVRFENLTDPELGALLTALDLPESKRHHVGMGKPLGMGSTRIGVGLHLIDRKERYARLTSGDGTVETGEVDGEQAQNVASRARNAFEATILEHAAAAGDVESRPESLWEIPRLAALGALLEWDGAPSMVRTGYKRPQDEGQRFPPFWKERRVLPDPAGVLNPPRGGPGGSGGGPQPPPVQEDAVKPGEVVRVVVLPERTKKGGWRFQVHGSEITAVLHPRSPEPPNLEPDRELRLKVETGGTTPQLVWEGDAEP